MADKKLAKRTSFISFIIVTLAGFFLHFAFELSGGSTLVGAFTPINESIWEHLKLVLFPSIVIAVFEYFSYGKKYEGYLGAKSLSIIIGMIFIVVAYYTYTGIIGADYAAVNIAIYVVAIIVTTVLTYYLTVYNPFDFSETESIIGITAITIISVLFIYFTFYTPQIEIFRDPVTEDFGIADALTYF